MPRARPEMTTNPASPRSRASEPANFNPAPDALREPTIAIIGRHQRLDRAAHAEQGRRVVDRGEPWRVAGFSWRNQADADFPARVEFRARLLFAADAAGTRRAATPRQIGQALQRRAGIAEMTEERVEGARADIVRADQAQPVDPLGIR